MVGQRNSLQIDSNLRLFSIHCRILPRERHARIPPVSAEARKQSDYNSQTNQYRSLDALFELSLSRSDSHFHGLSPFTFITTSAPTNLKLSAAQPIG